MAVTVAIDRYIDIKRKPKTHAENDKMDKYNIK